MKHLLSFTYFCLLALTITSCNGSFTTSVPVKEGREVILEEIQKSYKFEKLELLGTKKSEEDNLLTVNLINGEGLPDDEELNVYFGKVAYMIHEALEQPNEYPLIKVVAMTKAGNSMANTSTSKGFVYDMREQKQ